MSSAKIVAPSQHLRHVALDDLLGEPFGDRRLADAGIADIERVVLGAPAEHLDGAPQLQLAADQRIDLAGARLGVQIDAPGVQGALLAASLFRFLGLAAAFLARAAHRTDLLGARPLGDAVRDVVHRIIAGHVLLLQEIGGVALALGEDRDEHVGAGHLLAAGRLHVDDGALDDALEAGGRLGVLAVDADEVGELGVDIFVEVGLQLLEVDVAGAHDGGGVLVVEQAPAGDARAWRIPGRARWRSRAPCGGPFRGSGRMTARITSQFRSAGRRPACSFNVRRPDAALRFNSRSARSFPPLTAILARRLLSDLPPLTSFPSRIAADAGACGRNPSPASPSSRRPRR